MSAALNRTSPGPSCPSINNSPANGIQAQSDSELSDINGDVLRQPSLSSPSSSLRDKASEAELAHSHDQNASAEDQADADGSDASDISSRPEPSSPSIVSAAGSSGVSSRSTNKRKFDDDHDIRANPQLYGLRRSGRDVQRRRMVESSSEESDSACLSKRTARKRKKPTSSVTASNRPTPIRHIPVKDSRNEEDDEDYRAGKSKKKNRRSSLLTPHADKQRWSTRRAAQVTNGAYAESDDDNDSEFAADTGQYQLDPTPSGPYVDKVLKHRVAGGNPIKVDTTRDELEYFVKWTGKSHVHNTWETFQSLKGMNSGGLKKVENYFRRHVEQEKDVRFNPTVDPDVREQYFIDRERDQEAYDDYTKVERVVDFRADEPDSEEYYVKWRGLTYDECTWEEASLVMTMAQDKVDQYLTRSTRPWKSDASETKLSTRKPMGIAPAHMKQPTYIKGGELRPFQLQGLYFLCHNWTVGRNVILADEMGLGKTVQTVSFLSWLKNDRRQEGPFLVVAPLSVIPAWSDTFNLWAPDLNYVVYTGPEAARKIIREKEWFKDGNPKKHKFHVLLTTYDFVNVDSDHLQTLNWQAMAVDEAHRLKNREGKIYQKLGACAAPCKLLITGTPIQNNLSELAALMDFLNPGEVTINEELETLQILPTDVARRKLDELHADLKPYILRRTKGTVEKDLPPKTEKILRVELADVQLEYYKNILTRNYAELTKANGGRPQSLLNIMMELKKVSNHPYMFHGVEQTVLNGSQRREDRLRGLVSSSGKMMLLDQLLIKLKRDNHRVLIFSQMVSMLEILAEYMSLSGYQYQRLDGTIPAGPRRLAIDHFNAEDSQDFCFLLSTRAGGLGINLMTADTVILFDSDWNPQADLQAMARAHRIGQKKPVNVYRLVAKETVEEEVLERARNKLLLEYLTIQAGVTDSEGKSKYDKEFKKKGLKTDEAKSADDIQYVLKMRSQKMFSLRGNQERLEQLDIDSILENAEITKTDSMGDKMNLSTGGLEFLQEYTDVRVEDLARDWDEIIPASDLAEIKAREEARAHEEYLRKAAEENAPRRAALKGSMRSNQMQADVDERAERLAKKRERDLAKLEAMEEQRAVRSDPKRPLNERETRNLIRAFLRYGDIDTRYDEIVADARLGERDHDFIAKTVREFVTTCERAVEDNNDRLRQEEAQSGKPLTKKDKKAVLVNFGEVRKINAETALERPPQLRLLREVIRADGDWRLFRVLDATKAPSYTCEWGSREDGMLLVGIDKHGFGAWTQIRDDPELGMSDKLFLDEHKVEKKESRSKDDIKSPGAVHLVRRADYLLSVLESKFSNNPVAQKAVENHHRNNRKSLMNGHMQRISVSASPAPYTMARSSSDRAEKIEKMERPERIDRGEKGDRVDRADRSDRFDRVDRIDRNDRNDRFDRFDKFDRFDRGDRGDRSTNDRDRQRSRYDRYHGEAHHRYRDRERDRDNRAHRDKRKRDLERDDDDHSPMVKARKVERSSSRLAAPPPAQTSPSDTLGDDATVSLKKRRHEAMANLRRLRSTDQEALRNSNDEYDRMWALMRPINPSIDKILQTKELRGDHVLKKRGAIMKEELQRIGDFIEEMYHNLTEEVPVPKFEQLMVRFWVFFADIWPFHNPKAPLEGESLEEQYMRCRVVKHHKSDKPERLHGIPKEYWKSHRQSNPDGLPPLRPRKV